MSRRDNIPEAPLGRSTERIQGIEEVQVHAKGEIPTVHSLPRIDELHSSISLLSSIFI